jgi:flagellar basal-body rod protein FlgB
LGPWRAQQPKAFPPLSLIDTTQMALEAGMRGAWLRQTLLTNNVANAETPGYQREDVNFQGALRSALAGGDSALEQVQFQPEVQPGSAGPEGNGVNVDQESAQLAENGLEYEAMTQVLGARESTLRSAMGVS